MWTPRQPALQRVAGSNISVPTSDFGLPTPSGSTGPAQSWMLRELASRLGGAGGRSLDPSAARTLASICGGCASLCPRMARDRLCARVAGNIACPYTAPSMQRTIRWARNLWASAKVRAWEESIARQSWRWAGRAHVPRECESFERRSALSAMRAHTMPHQCASLGSSVVVEDASGAPPYRPRLRPVMAASGASAPSLRRYASGSSQSFPGGGRVLDGGSPRPRNMDTHGVRVRSKNHTKGRQRRTDGASVDDLILVSDFVVSGSRSARVHVQTRR